MECWGRRARPGAAPFTRQKRAMHLSPRELDHLRLAQAGQLAQRRLARGLRLNQPEACALIAAQMLEMIRDGESVATLMTRGQQLLEQLWSEPVAGDVEECALKTNLAVLADVPGTGQSHAPAGVLHCRIAAAVIDQSLHQRTPPSHLDRLLEHPIDVKALAPGEQAEGG